MTQDEYMLISDAIKIGFPILGTMFGAIVGAISAYFVTTRGYKHDLNKLAEQRRHELITETCQGVAEFEHLIATYSLAVTNHVRKLPNEIDMESARQGVIAHNKSMRLARANLKILGLKEAEKHLEEYLEVAREVMRKALYLDPDRAVELNKIITRGPVKFYEALSGQIFLGENDD